MKHAIVFLFIIIPFFSNAQFEGSGWCQGGNNVNGSTIPPALNDNKRAVFSFYWVNKTDGKTYDCTGTLINQSVSQGNLQQYFLTARHCSHDVDFTKNFTFVFNYQSPDASNASVPIDART